MTNTHTVSIDLIGQKSDTRCNLIGPSVFLSVYSSAVNSEPGFHKFTNFSKVLVISLWEFEVNKSKDLTHIIDIHKVLYLELKKMFAELIF